AVARAHAVVCSSRSEGLGLALLEAMAMARPILGFAVGGVAEIVTHDQTGWLTGERTPAALAALVARAHRDPPRPAAMGSAARARVERPASARAAGRAYGPPHPA